MPPARLVRTDIDQLRSLHYDIDACRGMGGGYQLRPTPARRARAGIVGMVSPA